MNYYLIDITRRRERVRDKFIALRKENLTAKYCNLAAKIVESEVLLPDGIKSLSGVIKIIKIYNLK